MAHPVKRNEQGVINVEDFTKKLQKQVYDKVAEFFIPENIFDEHKMK